MNNNKFCRLCALEKTNLIYIHGEKGCLWSLESKIRKCLNIDVSKNVNLPKSVCLDCCSKLNSFSDFSDSCNQAQSALRISLPYTSSENVKNLTLNKSFRDINQEVHFAGNVDRAEVLLMQPLIELTHNSYERISPNHDEHENNKCKIDFCQSIDLSSNPQKSNVFSKNNIYCKKDDKSKDWEPKIWPCADCCKKFSVVDELRNHYKKDHQQNIKFTCPECSKIFQVFTGFISHMKCHKNSFKYKCAYCDKGYSNKKMLDSHRMKHLDIRPYTCQQCGKSFRLRNALYGHSKSHLPEDIKNKYPCDQCSKRFSSKPNLIIHKKIHTGIRNFTCEQCGKSFIQKGNLDSHILTHMADKLYSCSICNKRFRTVSQLRKHNNVHSGDKPYHCDICGKSFRERGTLRTHHRIHSGVMPFSCEFCGKSFRFKGILTTHRRQHTGERPYSCLDCEHHFTNWPNYSKHMKRRHGINISKSHRMTTSNNLQNKNNEIQLSHQASVTPPSESSSLNQELSNLNNQHSNILHHHLSTANNIHYHNIYQQPDIQSIYQHHLNHHHVHQQVSNNHVLPLSTTQLHHYNISYNMYSMDS